MEKKEFSTARQFLGKSQSQMAQLLGVSLKGIQSFQQGWRNIPVHIERQVLFLLVLTKPLHQEVKPCWVIRGCPAKVRQNCPAWQFQTRRLCWFINGTICGGKVQESWQKKMKMCRQCEVFQAMMPIKDVGSGMGAPLSYLRDIVGYHFKSSIRGGISPLAITGSRTKPLRGRLYQFSFLGSK